MKTYEEIVKELDAKIPRDAVSERKAEGGRTLSYLEAHYVIDRLNQVLGQGNWSYESEVTKVWEGKTTNRNGEVFAVSYTAKVSLYYKIADNDNSTATYGKPFFTDYGYGDGTDSKNPGKAHELAVKEAVSDGIKRCAKNLGMSMGLALYNKTQEMVDDGNEEGNSGPGAARSTEQDAANASRASAPTPTKKEPVQAASNKSAKAEAPKRELVQKLIQQHIKVIADKKLKTVEEIRAQLQANHGVAKSADLTDEGALKFLDTLKAVLA